MIQNYLSKEHHAANIFFILMHYFGDTHDLVHQHLSSFCLDTSNQLSVFPNNSDRICLIKLKMGILYHMNNTFRYTVFQISVPESLFFYDFSNVLRIIYNFYIQFPKQFLDTLQHACSISDIQRRIQNPAKHLR